MNDVELNCEYITKLVKLPFFLQSARCTRLLVKVPLSTFNSDPVLVSLDHIDVYMSMEDSPEPRSEEEILGKEVYERIMQEREESLKEAERKKEKKRHENEKQEEKLRERREKEKQRAQKEGREYDLPNLDLDGQPAFDFNSLPSFSLKTGLPRFLEKLIISCRVEIKSLALHVSAPLRTETGTSPESPAIVFRMKDLMLYSTNGHWELSDIITFSNPNRGRVEKFDFKELIISNFTAFLARAHSLPPPPSGLSKTVGRLADGQPVRASKWPQRSPAFVVDERTMSIVDNFPLKMRIVATRNRFNHAFTGFQISLVLGELNMPLTVSTTAELIDWITNTSEWAQHGKPSQPTSVDPAEEAAKKAEEEEKAEEMKMKINSAINSITSNSTSKLISKFPLRSLNLSILLTSFTLSLSWQTKPVRLDSTTPLITSVNNPISNEPSEAYSPFFLLEGKHIHLSLGTVNDLHPLMVHPVSHGGHNANVTITPSPHFLKMQTERCINPPPLITPSRRRIEETKIRRQEFIDWSLKIKSTKHKVKSKVQYDMSEIPRMPLSFTHPSAFDPASSPLLGAGEDFTAIGVGLVIGTLIVRHFDDEVTQHGRKKKRHPNDHVLIEKPSHLHPTSVICPSIVPDLNANRLAKSSVPGKSSPPTPSTGPQFKTDKTTLPLFLAQSSVFVQWPSTLPVQQTQPAQIQTDLDLLETGPPSISSTTSFLKTRIVQQAETTKQFEAEKIIKEKDLPLVPSPYTQDELAQIFGSAGYKLHTFLPPMPPPEFGFSEATQKRLNLQTVQSNQHTTPKVSEFETSTPKPEQQTTHTIPSVNPDGSETDSWYPSFGASAVPLRSSRPALFFLVEVHRSTRQKEDIGLGPSCGVTGINPDVYETSGAYSHKKGIAPALIPSLFSSSISFTLRLLIEPVHVYLPPVLLQHFSLFTTLSLRQSAKLKRQAKNHAKQTELNKHPRLRQTNVKESLRSKPKDVERPRSHSMSSVASRHSQDKKTPTKEAKSNGFGSLSFIVEEIFAGLSEQARKDVIVEVSDIHLIIPLAFDQTDADQKPKHVPSSSFDLAASQDSTSKKQTPQKATISTSSDMKHNSNPLVSIHLGPLCVSAMPDNDKIVEVVPFEYAARSRAGSDARIFSAMSAPSSSPTPSQHSRSGASDPRSPITPEASPMPAVENAELSLVRIGKGDCLDVFVAFFDPKTFEWSFVIAPFDARIDANVNVFFMRKLLDSKDSILDMNEDIPLPESINSLIPLVFKLSVSAFDLTLRHSNAMLVKQLGLDLFDFFTNQTAFMQTLVKTVQEDMLEVMDEESDTESVDYTHQLAESQVSLNFEALSDEEHSTVVEKKRNIPPLMSFSLEFEIDSFSLNLCSASEWLERVMFSSTLPSSSDTAHHHPSIAKQIPPYLADLPSLSLLPFALPQPTASAQWQRAFNHTLHKLANELTSFSMTKPENKVSVRQISNDSKEVMFFSVTLNNLNGRVWHSRTVQTAKDVSDVISGKGKETEEAGNEDVWTMVNITLTSDTIQIDTPMEINAAGQTRLIWQKQNEEEMNGSAPKPHPAAPCLSLDVSLPIMKSTGMEEIELDPNAQRMSVEEAVQVWKQTVQERSKAGLEETTAPNAVRTEKGEDTTHHSAEYKKLYRILKRAQQQPPTVLNATLNDTSIALTSFYPTDTSTDALLFPHSSAALVQLVLMLFPQEMTQAPPSPLVLSLSMNRCSMLLDETHPPQEESQNGQTSSQAASERSFLAFDLDNVSVLYDALNVVEGGSGVIVKGVVGGTERIRSLQTDADCHGVLPRYKAVKSFMSPIQLDVRGKISPILGIYKPDIALSQPMFPFTVLSFDSVPVSTSIPHITTIRPPGQGKATPFLTLTLPSPEYTHSFDTFLSGLMHSLNIVNHMTATAQKGHQQFVQRLHILSANAASETNPESGNYLFESYPPFLTKDDESAFPLALSQEMLEEKVEGVEENDDDDDAMITIPSEVFEALEQELAVLKRQNEENNKLVLHIAFEKEKLLQIMQSQDQP
ncbi:hypothetical protein BLNAU_15027 [Blattamonas nauphoetae]|uniref:Autophagy-related protein 2 n=1 Tax=Blattamonas nauphoetae TaxID=2049346 RepID=A0ABQ9XH76_9EUKA|nr:hypothetical protein BLNAU_15027 [Blattamonas nauphoetae]